MHIPVKILVDGVIDVVMDGVYDNDNCCGRRIGRLPHQRFIQLDNLCDNNRGRDMVLYLIDADCGSSTLIFMAGMNTNDFDNNNNDKYGDENDRVLPT
jgi:hypothetical protein